VVRDRERNVRAALAAIEQSLGELRQQAPAAHVLALGTAHRTGT
jgi:hypothetical protein